MNQVTDPIDSPNVKTVFEPEQTDDANEVKSPIEEAGLIEIFIGAEKASQAPFVNLTLYQVSCVKASVDNVLVPLAGRAASITDPIFSNASESDIIDFCHWILPTELAAKVKKALEPVQIVVELAVIVFVITDGLIFTETRVDGELQVPLVATALYHLLLELEFVLE